MKDISPPDRLPDEATLRAYYELWCQGHTVSGIMEQLGIEEKQYKSWEPYFFWACRKGNMQKISAGATPIQLTQGLRENFLDLIRSGIPVDKAARAMNVPLTTVLEIWFHDPIFKTEVDFAVEMANVEITQALFKKAKGFTSHRKSTTKTKTTGRVSDTGTPLPDYESTSTTESEEEISGNVEAQKFWLINKSPEGWNLDGSALKSNNKGAILSAIDKMTEMTEEDQKFFEVVGAKPLPGEELET